MAKQSSHIPFVKMQGTGNDFVVINNLQEQYSLEKLVELTPGLCDRKYGVGADGLLAIASPTLPDTDYTMIYRNADGSDAGMCGNGSRCLALFASHLGMGAKFRFSVHKNIYTASLKEDGLISVSFPANPRIEEYPDSDQSILYSVNTGTEHIVKKVPEQELDKQEQLIAEGRRLRYDERFKPKGTNVNFFCTTGDNTLKLRTYEKGVEGLTLACGTGAIASALVWHHLTNKQGDNDSRKCGVMNKGGLLSVSFAFDDKNSRYKDITLEGPAQFVFEGNFYV